MKISVQAKEIKVTGAIQDFVADKSKQMLSKFGKQVIGVKVYLESITRKKSDPNSAQAKVEIQIPGENVVVEEKSFDPYQAISKAIKGGARKLRKKKEKEKRGERKKN